MLVIDWIDPPSAPWLAEAGSGEADVRCLEQDKTSSAFVHERVYVCMCVRPRVTSSLRSTIDTSRELNNLPNEESHTFDGRTIRVVSFVSLSLGVSLSLVFL